MSFTFTIEKQRTEKQRREKVGTRVLMMEDGLSGISTFLCSKPWNIHILFVICCVQFFVQSVQSFILADMFTASHMFGH